MITVDGGTALDASFDLRTAFPASLLRMTPTRETVVLFDGICNLCARSVRFILEHEREPTIRFASVQSIAGARLMRQSGLDPTDPSTFVLIVEGTAYTRSDAAIRIARRLRGAWQLLAVFWIIPRPLRDWAYDLIARNRYRWFGRCETCLMPTPQIKERFLED